MREIRRFGWIAALLCMAFSLIGCGKKDKLKLVTTEKTIDDATELDATISDAKSNRQEASDEEKQITLEQIYNANKGDVLLSSGYSYRMDTEYYNSDGTVLYHESQFLGFTEDGNYLQASEDENGVISVLDKGNGYWYVLDGDDVKIQLYPEPTVADAIINFNHNDFVISLTDSNQTIKDVYRLEGNLVVETDYTSDDGNYVFQYTLNESLRVLEFSCNSVSGNKLSCSTITEDASYELPDAMISDWESGEYRTVIFEYPDEPALKSIYYVPCKRVMTLELLEYYAYSDEECTVPWYEDGYDEETGYSDTTVYMKK